MSSVKLYNDDCVEVLNRLPHKSVDCVICDLPYFKVVKDDFDNQWKTEDEYLTWVKQIITITNDLMKDDSNIFLFTSRQLNRKICQILDYFFDEKRIIIWNRKRGFNNTRGHALASGYEPICYFSKGQNPTFNNIKIQSDSKRKEYQDGLLKNGVSLSDSWSDIPALPHNSKEKVNHPTQKPVSLMERIVQIGSNENDTVLDMTMGSGTTGVACQNLNRNFIGIEKDDTYFNIAKIRLTKQEQNLF